MRKKSTFSLDHFTANLIDKLAAQLGMSKTELVSKAIEEFAENNLKTRNNLLRLAGSLSAETADQMLGNIYQSRINKESIYE